MTIFDFTPNLCATQFFFNTFKNEADYDSIDLNDELIIENLKECVSEGKDIVITNKTKGKQIECECELSERAKKIILAGGLLSYTKEQM